MKVSALLEARQPQWRELEQLCARAAGRSRRAIPPDYATRLAARYRAACADLALADAYQFPPATIQYLHQLVGRAHNQLYRARIFRWRQWWREMFVRTPRRLFSDNCLRLALLIFWGVFALSGALSYANPEFGQTVMGKEETTSLESQFAIPIHDRDPNDDSAMAGFYIWNNPSIGLRCFAFGLFFGVGGLFATVYNAAVFGAACGYMATTPHQDNFFTFVTAHGPLELTAIVFCAAAGMRLGFSLVSTHGMGRIASLRQAGEDCMPVACAAVVMFLLAAGIEGFLSPSAAPYWIKAAVAVASALMIVFYVLVLGYWGNDRAIGPEPHRHP
jgi:uncharacterized membrane protein SpoIIM required for sporulation